MIEEVFVTRAFGCFGAHAAVGSAGAVAAFVGEEFVAVDAQEFACRKAVLTFESVSESASERAAFDVAEFGDFDARGVEFECRAHGREKARGQARGYFDEEGFVAERVDAVDDVIEIFEVEGFEGLGAEDFLERSDVGVGVNAQEVVA